MRKKFNSSLWTYDFTVITIGSLVSLVGANLSTFAISLLVLDYTGSTLLYALFNVCYQLPMLVCPILAGPYLDRVSRKKAVYVLDYTSSAIYLLLFILLRSGWFNYPILLTGCMLIGCINGIYQVAYESFYPNLIPKGYYQKAYSVSSILIPLAAMMNPVAATIYDLAGSATPIFAINATCFFVAACFERTIRHQETHMDSASSVAGERTLHRFRRDFREGIDYIWNEKGLLIITLYFVIGNFIYGIDTLHLPFFRNNSHLFAAWPVAAVTLYSIVTNFNVCGRLVGGMIQYKVHFPKEKKFAIAIFVYCTICLLDSAVLFLPVPVMCISFFVQGVLSITSYNIRISATQAYVPDTKRARFNGTFHMMTALGSIVGSLTAGSLGEFLPERAILIGANIFNLLMIYLLMYRGRKHVARIYNQDL